MTVLRDDGLYRHLRFQRPGTSIYYFDLVTWPGYLTIVGDCGTYVFTRLADMFEFFESDHGEINPHYWAEKLRAPSPNGAMRYSYELYVKRVAEWAEQHSEELGSAGRSLVRDVLLVKDDLNPATYSEVEAHAILERFAYGDLRIYDAWEWDLRDYDFQFLWCCHAIVWGIAEYRKRGENRWDG